MSKHKGHRVARNAYANGMYISGEHRSSPERLLQRREEGTDCDYPTRTDGDHIDRTLESLRMAVFDILDELPESAWKSEFWDVVREVTTIEQLHTAVKERTRPGTEATNSRLRGAAGIHSENEEEEDGDGRRV